ncbi:MAG: zinc metallopeptidase [Ruminococcaceae bacterium]|nr:zinc metallopeptidase [Oscillospiraceae bacterium]
MFFGLFWGDWTILVLIPAMIFALWAQARVNSTFKRYAKVHSRRGLTGAEAARRVLDAAGLYNVRIEHIRGHLTDHYDPRENVIRLSDATFNSTGIAAIGVAAHEAGHAVQHAQGYVPIKLRAAIIPITNIGSKLAMPLFLLGLIFAGGSYVGGGIGETLMLTGILFFSFSTLFQLVTLPTEFNASSRAMKALEDGGVLAADELPAAKKTLSAAAMTYVAALATSLASLLRLILIFNGNRRQ